VSIFKNGQQASIVQMSDSQNKEK